MINTDFTCRDCGGKLLPIIYGLPSPAMFKAAQNEEIILGGCVDRDDHPEWKCGDCGVDFRLER